MITSDGKLLIFENFVIDREHTQVTDVFRPTDVGIRQSILSESGGVSFRTRNGTIQLLAPEQSRSWFRRWWDSLWSYPDETIRMTVQEFFASLKNSVEELKVVNERSGLYEAAIVRARETRQKALVEQLEQGLMMARTEVQLVAAGQRKFVSEANVVKFYKLSERGLRLDWLANFTRPLPDDVAAEKLKSDHHSIFDNYVVLHYDPEAKSYAQTQKEIQAEREKKRDPILFGVIRGSRKLYFVADWIDEKCDLTLDDIAEKLGKSAVQVIP